MFKVNSRFVLESSAKRLARSLRASTTTDVIKIVGFDEDPATLDGIADGSVYGTIVQQP